MQRQPIDTYVFKFKKMGFKEVDNILMETVALFEVYVPAERSKMEYVVGLVTTEKEIANLKNILDSKKIELLAATKEEFEAIKYAPIEERYHTQNIHTD